MKMSWEYIAGFFDGEGCITVYDYKRKRTYKDRPGKKGGTWTMNDKGVIIRLDQRIRFFVLMVQKETRVLDLISQFLTEASISHSVQKSETRNMGRIQISAREEVKKFLELVEPFLIVKKEKTLFALDFINRQRLERGVMTY